MIVSIGMGLYLSAATLNQAALAQGQVRRASFCWIGCAVALPHLDRRAARRQRLPPRRDRLPGSGRRCSARCSTGSTASRSGRPRGAASSPARPRRWSCSSPRRTKPASRQVAQEPSAVPRRPGRRTAISSFLSASAVPIATSTSPALQDRVRAPAAVGPRRPALPASRRTRRGRPGPRRSSCPPPAQPSRDVDLLHPVLGRHVDDAGDLGLQGEARHLGPARLVGGDHPVGAGSEQLLLRVLDAGAGDDRDVGAELARGQAGEDVLGVRVDAGEHRDRPVDAGRLQHLVVRGPALRGRARPSGRRARLFSIELVDDDEVGPRRPGDRGRPDDRPGRSRRSGGDRSRSSILLQRAALLEDLPQVAGDEELRHRHQGVEERTHAQHDQQDLDDLARQVRRVGIGSDGRDGVQGEEESMPQRDVLGERVGRPSRRLNAR